MNCRVTRTISRNRIRPEGGEVLGNLGRINEFPEGSGEDGLRMIAIARPGTLGDIVTVITIARMKRLDYDEARICYSREKHIRVGLRN